MKKKRKSTTKASSKRRSSTRRTRRTTLRGSRKPKGALRRKGAPRRTIPRRTARTRAKVATKTSERLQAHSVAKLAASVLSRRAARAEILARPVSVEREAFKPATKTPAPSAGKHPKGTTARAGRGHGASSLPGNRPVARVSRAQLFTYMKAPGADSGFDVGDSVEVLCDHEQDGERVRGWVKGVVVQVDNKLVAVQFRSNVFLTDGWMVPDRILWYSLSSDQIRSAGAGKKNLRAAIPEY
jgi:hypothetical protein